MEIHKSIESKMSKMDSLQAVVENIEDEMGVFRAEMDANSQTISEIKAGYLSRATESTISHYFNHIAGSLQRELGDRTPHNKNKHVQESQFGKLY